MATLKQLKAAAAKHGAELEINKEYGEAVAWLPNGSRWLDTAAQCAVVSYGYTGAMASIYGDLIELIQAGIE